MHLSRGRVPNFKLRPHPVVMGILIFVFIVGLLTALSFFTQEDGSGEYKQLGILVLLITGLLCLCLGILATSKFWFRHLWKKNSSHQRHKQHTKYHPINRDHNYRKRR